MPSGLTNVQAIAACNNASLALTTDGIVVVWPSSESPPVQQTNVAAISAYSEQKLALKSNGTIVRWGRSGVSPPANLTNAVAVAAGYEHGVVLLANRTVRAWGSTYGDQTNVPPGLTNVTAIAAGSFRSAAIVQDGPAVLISTHPTNTVAVAGSAASLNVTPVKGLPVTYQWLWNGAELEGATNATLTLSNVVPAQAGVYSARVSNVLGSIVSSNAVLTVPPLIVVPAPKSRSAVAGQDATFIVSAQKISPFYYQWFFEGQVLAGATTSVLALTNLQPQHGGIYSVLVGNQYGEVTTNVSLTVLPLVIQTPPSSQTLLCGQNAAFSVVPGGVPPFYYQWRFNGADLPGATTSALLLTNVQMVQAGTYSVMVTNTLAATEPAATLGVKLITGWGSNTYGQINVSILLTNAYAVAAGGAHSLALNADGTVAAWGANNFGQANVPSWLTNAVAIATRTNHSLALRSDGTVVAWGSNTSGQTNVPAGLGNVIAIAAGSNHCLVLRSDETVVGWGDNRFGQTDAPAGLTNAVAIAAGAGHSLAVTEDGAVLGWGNNAFGQINIPPTVTKAVAVAAGNMHSLALGSDGRVTCWGG